MLRSVSFTRLCAIKRSIVILRAVVNNQAPLSEEEAVRLDLPGRFDNLLHLFWRELRHIIAKLPFVCTVGDDKAEAERVVLDHAATEVMPFNHLQVLNRLWSNTESHGQTHRLQMQEVRSKVVLNQALCRVISLTDVCLVFDLIDRHINEGDVRDHVPNAKAFEFKVRRVVGKSAQKLIGWARERSDIFCGYLIRHLLCCFCCHSIFFINN